MADKYFHTHEISPLIENRLLKNTIFLEAGCCGGHSAKTILEMADRFNKSFSGTYLFDSFVGLPEETPDIWHNPEWRPGEYSALKFFNLSDVSSAIDFCKNTTGRRSNLYVVDGFFDKTLTPELGLQLSGRAGLVNIDCDLHSSTKIFMDWLFTYNIPVVDCIFRFDDWLGTKYCEYHHAGENLAFEEITDKYSLSWENTEADNVFIYKGRKS